MIGSITGRVVKSGESQYGGWCLIEEPEVTTRDGKTFTPKVMCNGESVPPEGCVVVATGYAAAEVSESSGKHYANLKLRGAKFDILAHSASGETPPPVPSGETFDGEDIPFN